MPLPVFNETSLEEQDDPKNRDIKPHDSDLLKRTTLNSNIAAGAEDTDATPYQQNATKPTQNIKPAT